MIVSNVDVQDVVEEYGDTFFEIGCWFKLYFKGAVKNCYYVLTALGDGQGVLVSPITGASAVGYFKLEREDRKLGIHASTLKDLFPTSTTLYQVDDVQLTILKATKI